MRHHSYLTAASLSLALVCFAGCEGSTSPKTSPTTGHAAEEHDHDHPSEGPHHGQLIELGNEEFHAELVHDDAKNLITIYLLDGAAKSSVASGEQELVMNVVVDDTPQQFKLVAAPDASDPAGKSSRFQATDEAFGKALDAKGAKARLNVTLGGKPLVGSFEPAAHDHDEHHDHK